MTEDVIAELLREVWFRRPDAVLKEGMLALEMFKGPLTEESKNLNF